MDNKKTKLTLSGIAKKSIDNIELAKTQSKNSVVIEKKPSKFAPRGNFSRPVSVRSKPVVSHDGNIPQRSTSATKPSSPITNDYEKRKLAEQRATRRLKGESGKPDTKKIKKTSLKELKIWDFKMIYKSQRTNARNVSYFRRTKDFKIRRFCRSCL